MGKDLKGKELGKNLYQRKDGRYEAKARVNGIKIDIIDKDKKVVEKRLAEAKKQAECRVDYKKSNMTLDEYFNEWFVLYKTPEVKQSSIPVLKRSYKNGFGNYLGDKRITDITDNDIQAVINLHQKNGKAASTTRSALSLLEQCLERATRQNIIPQNPCYGLKVAWESESGKKLSRFLSSDEQKRFLEETETSWYKEMFYIMFYTGMRVGEVGGLKWEDIDFSKKVIHIQRSLSCNYDNGVKRIFLTTPKTSNSDREIPFFGECEEMLKSQKAKQQRLKKELGDRWRSEADMLDLVFTTTMGSPITRYIAEKEINKVVDAINYQEDINAKLQDREPKRFDKVYPHAIRHSFCSRCFEKKMNPKYVQQLMGHAHYSTTIDIYTHVTKDLFEGESEKFGSILE